MPRNPSKPGASSCRGAPVPVDDGRLARPVRWRERFTGPAVHHRPAAQRAFVLGGRPLARDQGHADQLSDVRAVRRDVLLLDGHRPHATPRCHHQPPWNPVESSCSPIGERREVGPFLSVGPSLRVPPGDERPAAPHELRGRSPTMRPVDLPQWIDGALEFDEAPGHGATTEPVPQNGPVPARAASGDRGAASVPPGRSAEPPSALTFPPDVWASQSWFRSPRSWPLRQSHDISTGAGPGCPKHFQQLSAAWQQAVRKRLARHVSGVSPSSRHDAPGPETRGIAVTPSNGEGYSIPISGETNVVRGDLYPDIRMPSQVFMNLVRMRSERLARLSVRTMKPYMLAGT